MFAKLDGIEKRFDELERRLVDPDVINDRELYTRLVRERAELEDLVRTWRERNEAVTQLEEARVLREDADADIRAMAMEETGRLER
ncbi:MAG: PCRF domain-containing protein, partial [Candidatus Binatia bacterium]